MAEPKTKTLFISDLHLGEKTPELNQAFMAFLEEQSRQSETIDALYILGDFFVYWLGDDCILPLHQQLAKQLHAFAQHTPIYFMHGNRDYLVNEPFCKQAGMTLLNEYQVIDFYGTPTLLLHGDSLCTLDEGYQKLRRFLRHPITLWLASALPASFKNGIAKKLSRDDHEPIDYTQVDKPEWDVVESTVRETFRFFHVQHMIHGHTHRPAHHQYTTDQHTLNRYVLGDWGHKNSIWWLELHSDGRFQTVTKKLAA
ncbi:MAG: UDP-2,3-diacylglucosamine diphosphatase [Pseudomonadota bacterium]|nr:UDP-2,3-diacylglucosamine diphosphatase [Pseudomonadota bacterium]